MSRSRSSWIIAHGSPDLAPRIRADLGAVPAARQTTPGSALSYFLSSRPRSRSSDIETLLKLSAAFQNTTIVLLEQTSDEAVSADARRLVMLNGRIVHDLPSIGGDVTSSAVEDLFKRIADDPPNLSPESLRTPQFTAEDWMNRALALARRQIGRVAPNPAVGCVIVKGGQLIGEGATGYGGRPHAEEVAVEDAGEEAFGGEVFVTLAPCGKRTAGRPSCSHVLAEAKVATLHAACEDPHPFAAHGLTYLTTSGVDTSLGLMREEAQTVNCGFFKVIRTGLPWLAVDLDPSRYDRAFEPVLGEDHGVALKRLAREGVTRMFIRPDTKLAFELTASGLVDEIVSP